MSTDYTVVSAVYGPQYFAFGEQWLAMLDALDPAPAEVILMADPDLIDRVKGWPVTVIPDASRNVAPMYSRAFTTTYTEWVSVMPLDDRYVPDAFRHLDDAGDADIVGFTIRGATGMVADSSLDRTTLHVNAVMSHSPFRVEMGLRLGGWPSIYWHDWAFWLLAKADGASLYPAPGFHVLYDDVTPGRLSATAPPGADAELAAYIKEHRWPTPLWRS